MQFPLRLILRPSPTLCACLGVLHGTALAGLLPLDVAWMLKIAVGAALAWSAWFNIRRYALLTAPAAIRRLTLAADGTLHCACTATETDAVACTVSPQSTVLPWLVVILLKSPQWRRLRPLVLLPDALSADEFRALRIWLRWKANKANVAANDA